MEKNSKKRKLDNNYEERSKHFKEFKGLKSLLETSNNEDKTIDETIEDKTIETIVAEKKIEIDLEKDRSSYKPKKTYVIIENLHPSITSNEMRQYLTNNGISYDKTLVLQGAVGIANFHRQKEMDRLFNVCQGLQYKANELSIFKLMEESVDDNNVSNVCETSVHVKNLDSSTNEEDINKILSDLSIKNISINCDKRTAILDFENTESAKSCIDLLDNKLVGKNVVSASFLVKSQRPDIFTLKVSNLPKGVKKAEIQKIFPLLKKIKMKKGAAECYVHFQCLEDMEKYWGREDDVMIGENKLTIEQFLAKKTSKPEPTTQYVLNLFNIPFDTTVNEIKDQYSAARFVEMKKNEEGKFVGSARLMYNDKASCEEALKHTKGLTFKHRRLRGEMKIEEYFSQKKSENSAVLADNDK